MRLFSYSLLAEVPTNAETKIKFMEDFSLDRRLYWRISDVYSRYDWEIIWHKNNLATPWQIKKAGSKKLDSNERKENRGRVTETSC